MHKPFLAILILGMILSIANAGEWTLDDKGGVYWENVNAKIYAYPAYSFGLYDHTQYLNFSYYKSNSLTTNISFVFEQPIKSGKVAYWTLVNKSRIEPTEARVYEITTRNITGYQVLTQAPAYCDVGDVYNSKWYIVNSTNFTNEYICFSSTTNQSGVNYITYHINTTVYRSVSYQDYGWQDISNLFTKTVIGDYNVFTINNILFQQGDNKYIKIDYSTTNLSSGKYSIYIHTGTPSQVVNNLATVYVSLDPWYNATYHSKDCINITQSNGLANYYFNISSLTSDYAGVRWTTNASGTEAECGSWWYIDNQTAAPTLPSNLWQLNCSLNNGVTEICKYYANTTVVNDKANVSTACRIGDNFNSGVIDAARWSCTGTAATINGSSLQVMKLAGVNSQCKSVVNASSYKTTLRIYGYMADNIASGTELGFGDSGVPSYTYFSDYGADFKVRVRANASDPAETTVGPINTTFTIYEIIRGSSSWTRFWRYANGTDATLYSPSANPIPIWIRSYNTGVPVDMDWVCLYDEVYDSNTSNSYYFTFGAWATSNFTTNLSQTNTWVDPIKAGNAQTTDVNISTSDVIEYMTFRYYNGTDNQYYNGTNTSAINWTHIYTTPINSTYVNVTVFAYIAGDVLLASTYLGAFFADNDGPYNFSINASTNLTLTPSSLTFYCNFTEIAANNASANLTLPNGSMYYTTMTNNSPLFGVNPIQFSVTVPIPLYNGSANLSCIGYDTVGNMNQSAPMTINGYNSTINVSITSPANGTNFAGNYQIINYSIATNISLTCNLYENITLIDTFNISSSTSSSDIFFLGTGLDNYTITCFPIGDPLVNVSSNLMWYNVTAITITNCTDTSGYLMFITVYTNNSYVNGSQGHNITAAFGINNISAQINETNVANITICITPKVEYIINDTLYYDVDTSRHNSYFIIQQTYNMSENNTIYLFYEPEINMFDISVRYYTGELAVNKIVHLQQYYPLLFVSKTVGMCKVGADGTCQLYYNESSLYRFVVYDEDNTLVYTDPSFVPYALDVGVYYYLKQIYLGQEIINLGRTINWNCWSNVSGANGNVTCDFQSYDLSQHNYTLRMITNYSNNTYSEISLYDYGGELQLPTTAYNSIALFYVDGIPYETINILTNKQNLAFELKFITVIFVLLMLVLSALNPILSLGSAIILALFTTTTPELTSIWDLPLLMGVCAISVVILLLEFTKPEKK